MNVFYSVWQLEDILFYTNVSLCNRHVAAIFKASVLKEVRILYPLSPQQHYNAANTTKVQNKAPAL